MSTDSEGTEQPMLAVSVLRSKFEKLAHDSPPPRPSSTVTVKAHDSDVFLSPSSSRHRALSNGNADVERPNSEHQLRPSSSSSDLKLGKRPPPPPPIRASSKPLISVPLIAPTPRPAAVTISSSPLPAADLIQIADKSSLISRKPPPPPPSAPLPTGAKSPVPDLPGPHGPSFSSMRSKFSGPPPSFPSTRPPPQGNRAASHSSILSVSTRERPTIDIPSHQQRHSISNATTISPLIRLHEPVPSQEQESNPVSAAPPLPTRPSKRSLTSTSPETHSRNMSWDTSGTISDSSASASRMSSDSDRSTEPGRMLPPPTRTQISRIQPSPPPRHPPRHSSTLPLSSTETLVSTPSDASSSTSSLSTTTLQVPPPFPARRSPPTGTKDLPTSPRHPLRSKPPYEREPQSAPLSSMERKLPLGSMHIIPPPTRTIALGDRLPPARKPASNEGSTSDSGDEEDPLAKGGRTIDLLPDSSNSSRRPPILSEPAFAYARPPVPAHGSIIAVAGPRVVVAHNHIKVYDIAVSDTPLHNIDLKDTGIEWRVKDARVSSAEFRPSEDEADHGRFLWLGTRDGTIWEMDLQNGSILSVRPVVHGSAVTHIFRHGSTMITADENGKALIFSSEAGGYSAMLTQSQPRMVRITDKQGFARVLGDLLWTSGGPGSGSSGSIQTNVALGGARGPMIRVYDILSPNTSVKSILPLEHVGAVTSGTVMQTHPDQVFLGHEGGYVTIWHTKTEDGTPVCIEVVKVSASDVLCLEGVNDRLWAGGRSGVISAYDIEHKPWTVTNNWIAHSELPVQKIFLDPYSIEKNGQLTVVSIGRDEHARFWDGLLGIDWIEGELMRREATFSSFRPLNVLVVSWNVDAAKPDTLIGSADNTAFLDNVLHSVDSPDIIAFGFQELIDLESRKMAAKTVLLGGKKKLSDGPISEKVSRSYKMWYDRLTLAVRLAMPPDCPYTVVHTENLVGLFSCIFIKSSERKTLSDVAISTVKRGIAGMYGNKGGIVARLVVDDSAICFINCHLAAGQHHVRARNADIAAIVEAKEVFPTTSFMEPVAYVGGGDGSMVLDHEIVFLNGDMNYRVEMRREAVISAVKANHLDQLLAHDQLLKEMKFNRGFRLRSFIEAPITFSPTYKYDRRSPDYDSSEKSRIPAWCDRILYRCRQPSRVQNLHYQRYEANISDHRPISAGFRVTVKSVDHEMRAKVKEEVECRWWEHQHTLLSNTRMFFVVQEII